MTIEGSEFRRVLGYYPTGVTVITAVDDAGPTGMAIGSFVSVSLDPPLVAFLPQLSSDTWERMKPAGNFCVNVLGDDQQDLCGVFAGSEADKFAGVGWRSEATGAPVIAGSIAWIDCELHAIHDGGDHDIVIGAVKALGSDADLVSEPRSPLLFCQGGYGRYEAL